MVRITRRRLLAAVGGVGAAAGTGSIAADALARPPLEQHAVGRPTSAATIESDAPPQIAVSWREIINGSVTETSDLQVDGDTGALGLLVDHELMPGDSGSVTMRVRLLERPNQSTSPAEIHLFAVLLNSDENGLTEPERAAGDRTPETGELDDTLQVRIWRDDGIFAGHGSWEPIPVVGDTIVESGTLRAVTDALTDGRVLPINGQTCLSPAASPETFVSFRWSCPSSAGNQIQSDSVAFQIGFVPRRCDNPG